MRNRAFCVIFLAAVILLAGCAPKVVGKRKHKKIRNCGCEWLQNPTTIQDSTTVCISEFE
jgi:hypothetical protein